MENSIRPFLVFHLDQRKFALDLDVVDRVVQAAETIPLVHESEHVRGLINISGDVIPVVDTRILLGAPSREMELEDRFILVHANGKRVALHVDAVEGVAMLPAGLVEWPQARSGHEAREFPAGSAPVATVLGDIVLVQDVDVIARAASLEETNISMGEGSA
jgi:chemotaxis signal transduction protein